jgi:hypothetical protein
MISFSQLGNMGHVGNQMFQYAALKGIAKKNNYKWAIPPEYLFGTNYHTKSSLYDIFTLPSVRVEETILPANNPILQERQFNFDQDLFDNCPDNVDLNGYFQSYKYFENIKDEILNDFTFKNSAEKPFENYVSIHIRRGDYVPQPQFHPVCDAEYYKKAMEYFPGHKFLVFSDDIEWCSQQEVFKDCYFSANNSVATDLYLMSQAEHNIIANSSFSWWAAYLNKNGGTVICPEIWFGVNYSHYNMSDLRPEEWIKL